MSTFLQRRAWWLTATVVILILGDPSHTAFGIETIEKKQTLTSHSSGVFSYFGQAIALSEKTLAIGAPRHDTFWQDSGAVYLFTFSNNEWFHTQTLYPPHPRQNGMFGSAISITSSTLFIGEPGGAENIPGRVYLYTSENQNTNQWSLNQIISRPDDCHLNNQDKFGSTLSASHENLLIGAPTACRNRENWYEKTGAAYLYSPEGNFFIQKLTAINSEDGDGFGSSVALCEGFAFVGAPYSDGGEARIDNGSVYLFSKRDGWNLNKFLQPSDTLKNSHFGMSIACTDRHLAIGAPGAKSRYDRSQTTGFVNYYSRHKGGKDNWGIAQKLYEKDYYNPDDDTNYLFGISLSLNETHLMVGHGHTDPKDSQEVPKAHIFQYREGKFNLLKRLVQTGNPSCKSDQTDFAHSVATLGNHFFFGSPIDETGSNCLYGQGSVAFLYKHQKEVQPLPFLNLLLRMQ